MSDALVVLEEGVTHKRETRIVVGMSSLALVWRQFSIVVNLEELSSRNELRSFNRHFAAHSPRLGQKQRQDVLACLWFHQAVLRVHWRHPSHFLGPAWP